MSNEASSIKRLNAEEWEQAWQAHWKKAQLNYELPPSDKKSANDERQFLTEQHSKEKELKRLGRINKEFEMGFKKRGRLGPAVTVFGSARFKPGEPFYELSRKTGNAFSKAGFTVLTGGGPGAMEATNRGAHQAAGGLGTLDELFEAATLIQCQKIGPFLLILIGREFWSGLRDFVSFMASQGVFTQQE